jgi:hypothetical protein
MQGAGMKQIRLIVAHSMIFSVRIFFRCPFLERKANPTAFPAVQLHTSENVALRMA